MTVLWDANAETLATRKTFQQLRAIHYRSIPDMSLGAMLEKQLNHNPALVGLGCLAAQMKRAARIMHTLAFLSSLLCHRMAPFNSASLGV